MLLKLGKRGQTTAEYAILFAIVVGAVVGMQLYVKRGLQGRVRNAVDTVALDAAADAGADNLFTGEQYEPYYNVSQSQVQSGRREVKQVGLGGEASAAEASMSRQSRQNITGWDATDVAAPQAAVDVTDAEVQAILPAIEEVTRGDGR